MAGYSVAHLDDIEEFSDAGCHYRPIRHHLGITAFGVTAWTARAAGDLVINEHDEDDPTADQELFLVLRGHAVFELDGDRVDAPAGTLVFAPPRTKRTASAKQEGTTIILVEGTPGKPYEARGWELWAPLAPLYEAGDGLGGIGHFGSREHRVLVAGEERGVAAAGVGGAVDDDSADIDPETWFARRGVCCHVASV